MKVSTYHQVYPSLVQQRYEMDIEPTLKEIVFLVLMVDHRNVKQTDLHRSSAEKRLLDCLASPFNLLVYIIFIHRCSAVKDRAAMAGFTGIKHDESNRSLAECIIERSRIRVRENVRYKLCIVTAAFVVTTGKVDRQSSRKGSERFQNIVNKRILHIVTGTCNISVQEEEISSGRVNLRCQGAILIEFQMNIIKD